MAIKKIRFTDDGSRFLVDDNPTAIVTMMRDTSRFASDQTFFEYMEGFADRYRIQSGNSVRCDKESHFVEDLFKFGFLEEIPLE